MRRNLSAAALLTALAFGGAAQAQSGNALDLTPTGISVRAGVVIPLDRTLTNVGNSLIGLGVEYRLPRPLLANGDSYFALDYFFKGFGGVSGSVMPFTLNHRIYSGSSDYRRSYVFFGAGFSYINVNGSGTAITFRGGVGQELGRAIFAEIAATLSDRAGGARANSLGFSLGYRF